MEVKAVPLNLSLRVTSTIGNNLKKDVSCFGHFQSIKSSFFQGVIICLTPPFCSQNPLVSIPVSSWDN